MAFTYRDVVAAAGVDDPRTTAQLLTSGRPDQITTMATAFTAAADHARAATTHAEQADPLTARAYTVNNTPVHDAPAATRRTRTALADAGEHPAYIARALHRVAAAVDAVRRHGGTINRTVAAYDDTLAAHRSTIAALGYAPPDPDVPGPPPEPVPDEGAGEFDSDPWWSTADDRVTEELARLAATAAEAMGWTDAARHLRHYLDGNGDDLTVDPSAIIRDVPAFGSAVDQTLAGEIDRITRDAAAGSRYGEPVTFSTDWAGFYVTKDLDANWFYADGGIQYSTTGVVTVAPPAAPGAAPEVSVDYQVHVWDRYNWDGGKSTDIGPITVTDESLAELHRAGVAREYDVTGSTSTQHFQGAPPEPGAPVTAPGDGRDGTRSDPGRDRHTGRGLDDR